MELPLNLSQPFQAYNHFAFYFGILLMRKENYTYFYSHTMEMIAFIEKHGNIVFLPQEEIIGEEKLPIKMQLVKCLDRSLSDKANYHFCITEIKHILDQKRYLFENFDEYYIPHRPVYQKEHFVHNFLINGYDDKNFFVWGYTDRGQFEKVLIPYRNVYDALMAISYKDKQRFIWANPDFHYEFDLSEIKMRIYNYLAGNAAYDFGEGTECGIDFIKFIIDDLNGNLEHFDFKYYRTVKEHKHAMRDRIKWLFEKIRMHDKNILNLTDQICKYTDLSYMFLLKFNFTQQLINRERAVEALCKTVDLELICYTRLLELL